MTTRSVRTPLSIKIVVGCFLIGLALILSRIVADFANDQMDVAHAIGAVIDLTLIAFQFAALPRLSRWAPISQTCATALSIGSRYIADPEWTRDYPMLGPFVMIIPLAIYLALVLPHWRKMNWAPLGLPYRAANNPADVF